MIREEWLEFKENVLYEKLSGDEQMLLEEALEDWTGYIESLESEIQAVHKNLTRYGIGKSHWSLLGRVDLLQGDPKGNVFESRVVILLLAIKGLVALCDEGGLNGIEVEAARHLLLESHEWCPEYVNLEPAYITPEERRRQLKEAFPFMDLEEKDE